LKFDQAAQRVVVDLLVRRKRRGKGSPQTMGSEGPTHAVDLSFFPRKGKWVCA
jgi:hypothetical protein